MLLSCIASLTAAVVLVMLSIESHHDDHHAAYQTLYGIIQGITGACDILTWICYYSSLSCKTVCSGGMRNSMNTSSEPDPDHIVFMASQTPIQPQPSTGTNTSTLYPDLGHEEQRLVEII